MICATTLAGTRLSCAQEEYVRLNVIRAPHAPEPTDPFRDRSKILDCYEKKAYLTMMSTS